MDPDRLESWKEIAAYLDRGVRTVQRWEKREGLPVLRHAHDKLGTVYAFKSEIDKWWEGRRVELSESNERGGAAPRGSSRRGSWIIAVGAGLVAAITALAVWPERPNGDLPAPLLVPIPVTTLQGSEYFPSFSPDGNHVAFTWIPDGRPVDIYAKAMDSEDVRQITNDGTLDLGPAWSPDGQWIAFVSGNRSRASEREVMVVSSLGGTPRRLATSQPDWGPFLAWTPDSQELIYSSCRPTGPCALVAVHIDTLEERQLTTPPAGPGGDTAPALSSSGRKLLFVRRKGGHTAQVHLQYLDSQGRPEGDPTAITPGDIFATAPAWASDSRTFFYMSGEVGVSMRLSQMEPRRGAEPKLLAALGDTFFEPGITVHGDRLIAMDLRYDVGIRKLSLAADDEELDSAVLTQSNRIDRFPHVSPDGSKIVYESTRHGGCDIYIMDVDGSNVVQLTAFGLDRARMPRWSPDGREVVFAGGPNKGDLYVISAAGGEPRVLSADPSDESLPSWSPDGRWIYFTSDVTGRNEVWKVGSSGGEAVQVTSKGGYRPIPSPDGNFVYYTKHEAGAPHGAPLCRVGADGREEQVFETPVFLPENFDVIADNVYYATESGSPGMKGMKVVRVFNLGSGEDREIGPIGTAPRSGLSVTQDGETVFFALVDSHEADLVEFRIP